MSSLRVGLKDHVVNSVESYDVCQNFGNEGWMLNWDLLCVGWNLMLLIHALTGRGMDFFD